MKLYLNVVDCAIQYQNKFLMIKRPLGGYSGGNLCFPGGKVDEEDEIHGADFLRLAAKREVLEEVGLDLQDPIHYVTSNFFIVNDVPIIGTVFHCLVQKTKIEVVPSKREVDTYHWMTGQEIKDADNSPIWLKEMVDQIKASL